MSPVLFRVRLLRAVGCTSFVVPLLRVHILATDAAAMFGVAAGRFKVCYTLSLAVYYPCPVLS